MTITEQPLITDPEEKKQLRDRLSAEYKRLTGSTLLCIERSKLSIQNYGPTAKKHLLSISCKYVGLSEADIISNSRKAELVKIRQMIAYLLSEMKVPREKTYTIVGYIDASTVTHSVQKVKGLLSIDKEYKEEYSKYKQHCLSELRSLIKPINKLTIEQENAILFSLKKGGITQKELAEIYGVCRNVIGNLVSKNRKNEEMLKLKRQFTRKMY